MDANEKHARLYALSQQQGHPGVIDIGSVEQMIALRDRVIDGAQEQIEVLRRKAQDHQRYVERARELWKLAYDNARAVHYSIGHGAHVDSRGGGLPFTRCNKSPCKEARTTLSDLGKSHLRPGVPDSEKRRIHRCGHLESNDPEIRLLMSPYMCIHCKVEELEEGDTELRLLIGVEMIHHNERALRIFGCRCLCRWCCEAAKVIEGIKNLVDVVKGPRQGRSQHELSRQRVNHPMTGRAHRELLDRMDRIEAHLSNLYGFHLEEDLKKAEAARGRRQGDCSGTPWEGWD